MARSFSRLALDPAVESGFAAARVITRRRVQWLYGASVMVPREKRNAACAVGAFFCMIEEALHDSGVSVPLTGIGLRDHPAFVSPAHLGSCGPGSDIDSRIAMLHDRLDEIYTSRLELPAPEGRSEAQNALHAFSQTVLRYQIPREHFLDYATGLRQGGSTLRYATWSSLEKHLNVTHGVVARAIASTLGLQHSDAGRQFAQIGIAIGLTRALINLKSDTARNQILLPLEDLARFRYSESDLLAGKGSDEFRASMQFEIARARDYFKQGAQAIGWLADVGSRLAASMVVVEQLALLRAIERSNCDVFSSRVHAPSSNRLLNLPQAWKLARRTPSTPAAGLNGR